MAKTRCWRKVLGERGFSVVLFERSPGGQLYWEVWVGGRRIRTKKSLKHRDKERAEVYGYRLLVRLKSGETARHGGVLTLQSLFDMYVRSPSFKAKKEDTQRDDRAKLNLVMDFLGPDRDVRTLSASDTERYRQARMNGEYGPFKKKVRANTVRADLVALCTMLNWATIECIGPGRFLLDRNRLRGVKLPKEKNPKRPIATQERYEATRDQLIQMANAATTDAERIRCTKIELALVLAYWTGRRIGSIRQLRWDDIDLEHETIRFRAVADKKGVEWIVPMSDALVGELHGFRRRLGAIGGLVFAAEKNPERPMDRYLFRKWLTRAEKAAGLPKLDGGLWHAYRRFWATRLKRHPLPDVAFAGGWRDFGTLLECYQQHDMETLKAVANGL